MMNISVLTLHGESIAVISIIHVKIEPILTRKKQGTTYDSETRLFRQDSGTVGHISLTNLYKCRRRI